MNAIAELLLGGGALVRSLRYLFFFFFSLIVLFLFVIAPISVDGHSMDPTLSNGQWILINKIVRTSTLKRGDIVVFYFPGDPSRRFIKRVIGLPGERIQVKDGALFVNGVELEESYIPADVKTLSEDQSEITVDPNSYFLSGDNREHSNDSRVFGLVDQRMIIGTAMLGIWPNVQVFIRPYYPPAIHQPLN